MELLLGCTLALKSIWRTLTVSKLAHVIFPIPLLLLCPYHKNTVEQEEIKKNNNTVLYTVVNHKLVLLSISGGGIGGRGVLDHYEAFVC